MKKLIILSLALIICLGFAFNAYAQEARELELEYPLIGGDQPETVTIPIPEYVRYIFNFAVWAAGILALLVLIYAGIQYFLSTGNPEKIKTAKERITSALIGLLILLGSYLILWSINPGLVTFELQRLTPIISELSPGVLVCKQEVPIGEAWGLARRFPDADRDEERIIAEQLESIMETISEHCYRILTSGNIRSDFNNEITDLYFIPGDQTIFEIQYLSLYGAVVYEDRNYEGRGDFLFDFTLNILTGRYLPVHMSTPDGLEISSIEPFVIIPQHQAGIPHQVTLYQKPNQNQGLGDEFMPYIDGLLPGTWWQEADLRESPTFWRDEDGDEEDEYHAPESIKVDDNFIAILKTGESEPYDDLNDNGQWDAGGWLFGRDEPYIDINDNNEWDAEIDPQIAVFFNEIDNNLLDDKNITGEKACREYVCGAGAMGGGGCAWIWTKCVEPAAEHLLIISAEIY
jgi:hypothetical protein